MTDYAIVKTSGTQSIANNTLTKVTGFTQVAASAGGLWNNGTERYECATTGWYELGILAEWEDEQTGAHLVEARINGTDRWVLSQVDGDWSVTATTGLVHGGQCYVQLTAGDYVECRVRQISGGSKNLYRINQFSIRQVSL